MFLRRKDKMKTITQVWKQNRSSDFLRHLSLNQKRGDSKFTFNILIY